MGRGGGGGIARWPSNLNDRQPTDRGTGELGEEMQHLILHIRSRYRGHLHGRSAILHIQL